MEMKEMILTDLQKMIRTCESAGIPYMSLDTCCRLLAILQTVGGNHEIFTHHLKLIEDVKYAQRRLNIFGGEIPDAEGVALLKHYIGELETYYENAPKKEGSEAVFSVKHLPWVEEFLKSRYNIRL